MIKKLPLLIALGMISYNAHGMDFNSETFSRYGFRSKENLLDFSFCPPAEFARLSWREQRDYQDDLTLYGEIISSLDAEEHSRKREESQDFELAQLLQLRENGVAIEAELIDAFKNISLKDPKPVSVPNLVNISKPLPPTAQELEQMKVEEMRVKYDKVISRMPDLLQGARDQESMVIKLEGFSFLIDNERRSLSQPEAFELIKRMVDGDLI